MLPAWAGLCLLSSSLQDLASCTAAAVTAAASRQSAPVKGNKSEGNLNPTDTCEVISMELQNVAWCEVDHGVCTYLWRGKPSTWTWQQPRMADPSDCPQSLRVMAGPSRETGPYPQHVRRDFDVESVQVGVIGNGQPGQVLPDVRFPLFGLLLSILDHVPGLIAVQLQDPLLGADVQELCNTHAADRLSHWAPLGAWDGRRHV
jgi:hypothetical protein